MLFKQIQPYLLATLALVGQCFTSLCLGQNVNFSSENTYQNGPYVNQASSQQVTGQFYPQTNPNQPNQNSGFSQPNNNQYYPQTNPNQSDQNQSFSQPNNINQPYQNSGFSQPNNNQYYPQPNTNQSYQNQPSPQANSFQPYQPNRGFRLAPSPGQVNEAANLTNQAYELSKSGNSTQAIVLLKQALAIDPSSSVAHLDMSLALIALKRYDEALKESSIVLQLNPNEERGYLNYLASAVGANHMQEALAMGQEYLTRFPKGKNRAVLSNEMLAVEQEMDRRAKTRGLMAPPGSPDNYLFLATPYGKRHWQATYMPIKVYINSGKHLKGFQTDYETILITAFLTWQNYTRGSLRFVPVDDPEQCNIECRWTDSVDELKLAAEAGDTLVFAQGGNIYHAVVTILTCRPDKPSERLTNNLVRQVCLHEIGHALGIDGHSDNAQDVMYCATDPNIELVQISQRDLNTLFLIYH